MSSRCVHLKPGKEKSLQRLHPWIFSGAIQDIPEDCAPGELLPVYASDKKFLALAYFQPANSLSGRVLSFSNAPIEKVLEDKLEMALKRREPFLSPATTAYRIINAEGDGLPGLIVDRYGDVLVLQATTAGIQRLKPLLSELLRQKLQPQAIYEKSHGQAMQQEGLEEQEGFLFGDSPDEIEILENGLKFVISLKNGQKTGFFLDQREMRKLIMNLSKGKRVLNGFAYTGGFSIAALKGGAESVDSVEISSKVEPLLVKNLALNSCDLHQHRFFAMDVFDFLSRPLSDYDILILDPPAFAKKRSDVEAACRGYKQLMLEVFRKAKPGALLLFSSCSYYVDQNLLQMLAFQAALEAGRQAVLLSQHLQAFDHPISLFHPEGAYLKSFLIHIS